MIGIILTTAAICTASWLIGQAAWLLVAGQEWSWLAPVTGFAVVLILTTEAIRLPGAAVTARAALLVAVIASSVVILRRHVGWPRPAVGLALFGMTGVAALSPFLVNGRTGILGVLDNADLSVHLQLADALRTGADPSGLPSYQTGYPTGPQSLAATMTAFGTNVETAFNAILVAVPVLTALTGFAAFEGRSVRWRTTAAVTVAMPYLAAAYLVQASFKEPMQALLVLAFVLVLEQEVRVRRRPWSAVPLGFLAGASLLTYGYAGLAWPIGIVLCWALAESARRRTLPSIASMRSAASNALAAAGVVALIVVVQLDRFNAFVGDTASVGGGGTVGGNIVQPISAFEVFGVWLSGDFRTSGNYFFAGLLAALAALIAVNGLAWSLRRGYLAFVAGVVTCVVLYAYARRFATAYYDAKLLMVMAPLVMVLMLRPLLPKTSVSIVGIARSPTVTRVVVAAVLLGAAGFSSALVLRGARVGPPEHMRDLISLRPTLEGERTLFLGQDDYVYWTLRGAQLSTAIAYVGTSVVPFATRPDKPFVQLSPGIAGQPLDFDSLDAGNLDRFRFVIQPRTAFSSAPPPNWRLRTQTASYQLWERHGSTASRETLDERGSFGALFDCSRRALKRLSRRAGYAAVRPAPVVTGADTWRTVDGPSFVPELNFAVVPLGGSVSQRLRLPPGLWDISMQYISPTPVRLRTSGWSGRLPANEDRGGPYWSAGTIRVRSSTDFLEVTAASLSPLARGRTASVGRVAATRLDRPVEVVPLRRACGRFVDWYRLRT